MEQKQKDLETFHSLLRDKKYGALRAKAQDMNVSDLAGVMEEMEDEDMLKMFRLLPKELAADVFSQLENDSQQYIITSLSEHEAGQIIDNLYSDDAADLLEEMPASVVRKLLANTRPDTRKDVNHLLQYQENSAGSIMTVEFIDLDENMTVEQALQRIRQIGMDSETVNICYVLDSSRKLIGVVALRYLIINDPQKKIRDIMSDDVVSCRTDEDQEHIAQMFQKYDFTALPVVDKENRMVGIITVDDIMDIMEQEATEDIDKMNAIIPDDRPYLKTGVFATWKKRIPWMLILLISAVFSVAIISHYENRLSHMIVLAAYIPTLMDTGGIAGNQASVEIMRAISLEEVSWRDFWKVIWKECRVGILCGLTLAAVMLVKCLIFDQIGLNIAITVCVTIICAVFFAKVFGSLLVLLFNKIGLDPALIASPVLSTIMDALSLLMYFGIATAILGF